MKERDKPYLPQTISTMDSVKTTGGVTIKQELIFRMMQSLIENPHYRLETITANEIKNIVAIADELFNELENQK